MAPRADLARYGHWCLRRARAGEDVIASAVVWFQETLDRAGGNAASHVLMLCLHSLPSNDTVAWMWCSLVNNRERCQLLPFQPHLINTTLEQAGADSGPPVGAISQA
jgi:hypothetical protein